MSCDTTCAAVVILQSVCFELAEHKRFTSDVNQSFNRSIGGHNLSNYILMLGHFLFCNVYYFVLDIETHLRLLGFDSGSEEVRKED